MHENKHLVGRTGPLELVETYLPVISPADSSEGRDESHGHPTTAEGVTGPGTSKVKAIFRLPLPTLLSLILSESDLWSI